MLCKKWKSEMWLVGALDVRIVIKWMRLCKKKKYREKKKLRATSVRDKCEKKKKWKKMKSEKWVKIS
jgi:hypothetical protein